VSVNNIMDHTNNIIKLFSDSGFRPDWDQYFIMNAFLTASRSPCERLHVGCVIVKEKHIIAHGYNGFLPGLPHIGLVVDGHEQMTVHAEQNAIADCAKRGVSVLGSTIYITHYPCINCAKVMLSAGVVEVKYKDDYKNSEIVAKLFEMAKVDVIKII
jgi:dCMP deaminase